MPLDGRRGLIVLEDDGVVRNAFVEKALAVVDEIEARYTPESYFLALAANSGCVSRDRRRMGWLFARYPAESFYGTSGMYFPAEVAKPLRKDMWEDGVVQGVLPGDLLLGKLAMTRYRLFAAIRDLVDHIGVVSTGLGGRGPSPTFSAPWPSGR